MVSPSSLATRLILLTLINPVLSSSNRSKILLIPFWGLINNYSGFLIAQSGSDPVEELLEIYLAALCLKVGDHVEDGGVFWLETEWLHGGLELAWVNFARGLSVEQVEGFSQLLDFVFGQAWSFDLLFETALDWLFSFHLPGLNFKLLI